MSSFLLQLTGSNRQISCLRKYNFSGFFFFNNSKFSILSHGPVDWYLIEYPLFGTHFKCGEVGKNRNRLYQKKEKREKNSQGNSFHHLVGIRSTIFISFLWGSSPQLYHRQQQQNIFPFKLHILQEYIIESTSMSNSFNDRVFRRRVDCCLERTREVLHRTKQLTTPEEVAHSYTDKYLIADYLGNSAIICYLNCLTKLGLSKADLSLLVSWGRSRDISLRLVVDNRCDFVKEVQRDVEAPTRHETKISGFTVITSKQITTVTEHFYNYKSSYQLIAYRGVGDKIDDRIVLQSRSSQQEIVKVARSCPYPAATSKQYDFNISWLLRCVDEKTMQVSFSIDRDLEDCHTPARNQQVYSALDFFRRFREWSGEVSRYFTTELFQVEMNMKLMSQVPVADLGIINTVGILVPVVPLVSKDTSAVDSKAENRVQTCDESICLSSTAIGVSSVALTPSVVSQLLSEQVRSLEEKCKSMSKVFASSSSTSIITETEACLLVVLRHASDVAEYYADGIQFIENMLRDQLVAAVGKILQASHFTEYMRYHNRKLFNDAFQSRPFSHAVRRTAEDSPEGSIRIEEQQLSGAMSEPIFTSCKSRSASQAAPMQFALNASTNVTFGGDRHLQLQ
jgi:hypothetical protein